MSHKAIHITGASQRTQQNGKSEWGAWYECHKCGEEFAHSSDFCRDEKTARAESDCLFDRQQRSFCYRCGYKLSDLQEEPESAYISGLNAQIDRLCAKKQELVGQIKQLLLEKAEAYGLTKAEQIAIANEWIKAMPCVEGEEAADGQA